jgi:hypothetical protein
MDRTHYLRTGISLATGVLAAVFATTSMHAQTLPAMQPTSLPAQAAAPVAAAPPANPPHHAEITFAQGQLEVRADNSSLNQILRSISRRTGLKITGGVEEQRVFGNYGPGSVSSVLATLLDGTETNILLLGGDATNPPELQLTPRSGGPTPPGPNSEAYAMYDDSSDREAPVPPPAPRSASESSQPETHGVVGSPAVPQPLNDLNVSPSHPAPTAAPLPLPHPDSALTPAANPAAASVVHTPNPAPTAVPGTAPNATATGSAAASAAHKPLTPEMVMQELLEMQEQQKLRKQELDEQIRKEQIEPQKKLKKQQPSSQNPTSSTPQQ